MNSASSPNKRSGLIAVLLTAFLLAGQTALLASADDEFEGPARPTPTPVTNSTQTAFSGTALPSGRIAFVSTRDGNAEIYVIRPDGSGLTRLTSNPATDGGPALAPDGTKIAFHSNRDGNSEIYVMNSNGSGLRRVSNHPANDSLPSWSPDGAWIAFTSNRDGVNSIYVMREDGSDLGRLTNAANPDYDPAWSPDGSRIAFSATRDGHFEIYVMNADGSGQIRLTKDGNTNDSDWNVARTISGLATDNLPSWTPDGQQILFRRGGAPGDLYLIKLDGTDMRRLITNASDAAWAPDGSKLVISSGPDLHLVGPDGSGRVRLTAGSQPTWAP
jgi:Tol biopolymer transport system component